MFLLGSSALGYMLELLCKNGFLLVFTGAWLSSETDAPFLDTYRGKSIDPLSSRTIDSLNDLRRDSVSKFS